jgi:hypothetical protein
MRQLTGFTISPRETDVVLHLKDDAGAVWDFSAGAEQLELVIEALEELISEDEDRLAGDDAVAAYQKPLG